MKPGPTWRIGVDAGRGPGEGPVQRPPGCLRALLPHLDTELESAVPHLRNMNFKQTGGTLRDFTARKYSEKFFLKV